MFIFAPIRWALRLLSLVVFGAAVYVVVSAVQVVNASHLPTATNAVGPAERIVVLGAPVQGFSPGADLAARLQQALLLYQAKRAPAIVVTGPEPAVASAASVDGVATRWLTGNGVPRGAISTVTAPNAASALSAVARSLGQGTQVIVVTDAVAGLWTRDVATADGLQAGISPAVGSERNIFSEIGPLWRQATGVAAGRVIGFSRATWAA